MKRFYLAVPVEYEEEVLKKIGELGAVQLARDIPVEHAEKDGSLEVYRSFMGLYERMKVTSGNVQTEKRIEEQIGEPDETILEQIEPFVGQVETKLDETMRTIEGIEKEIEKLKVMKERLEFLNTYKLKVNEIGSFKHIFVKAGFLNNALLPKLSAYISGTGIIYASKAGRPRESFIVVTGLNEDQPLVEASLKLLNFEEITLPQNLNPEPKVALEEVKNNIELKEREIQNLKEDLLKTKEQIELFEPYVSNALQIEEAKSFITRTKKKSLIRGWVPSGKTKLLETQVESTVPKESIYLKFENPNNEDKTPVQLENKGIFRSFEVFTYLRGVPNYFEVNPTPIYTFLYALMFGMMFGDMGGGALFIVLGFVLSRLQKGLLVFSSNTTRKLGRIMILCGFSSMFFGFLYDEFFLAEILPLTLLHPVQNITGIITVALVFGVMQISLALALNITNMLRRKKPLEAIFSGHGIVGLTYYLTGVFLAIAFIKEMNFQVFLQQGILPFTFVALASLAVIFLSPVIRTLIERRDARLSEKFIEGFGEGLETFIAFIANSVSYVRLAAFAVAHEALGLAAVIFASAIGTVPSFVLINVIVFVVEGFAAFIQSLRLMYYEFSTKFYVGDGVPYKPFKIISRKTKPLNKHGK
jgi:V/A-type H+-transporting ATPase subunit I